MAGGPPKSRPIICERLGQWAYSRIVQLTWIRLDSEQLPGALLGRVLVRRQVHYGLHGKRSKIVAEIGAIVVLVSLELDGGHVAWRAARRHCRPTASNRRAPDASLNGSHLGWRRITAVDRKRRRGAYGTIIVLLQWGVVRQNRRCLARMEKASSIVLGEEGPLVSEGKAQGRGRRSSPSDRSTHWLGRLWVPKSPSGGVNRSLLLRLIGKKARASGRVALGARRPLASRRLGLGAGGGDGTVHAGVFVARDIPKLEADEGTTREKVMILSVARLSQPASTTSLEI